MYIYIGSMHMYRASNSNIGNRCADLKGKVSKVIYKERTNKFVQVVGFVYLRGLWDCLKNEFTLCCVFSLIDWFVLSIYLTGLVKSSSQIWIDMIICE